MNLYSFFGKALDCKSIDNGSIPFTGTFYYFFMYMYYIYKNNDHDTYLKAIVYLRIKSKSATSGPPIGPILGQCGIVAAPFCKDFNERTKIFKSNIILFINLYLFVTGDYIFDINLPTTSFFLKRAVKLKKGYKKPGYIYSDIQELKKPNCLRSFRYITPYVLYEIFLYKMSYNS